VDNGCIHHAGTLFQTDIQTKEFRRIVDLQYIKNRRHDISKTHVISRYKRNRQPGDINGTKIKALRYLKGHWLEM
jgi:hypothetical protein